MPIDRTISPMTRAIMSRPNPLPPSLSAMRVTSNITSHVTTLAIAIATRAVIGKPNREWAATHALADDGRFANHDTRDVVDEEAAADFRAWVDVDAGLRMREFGDDGSDDRGA